MRTSKGSLLTSRVRASRFGRLVLDATLEQIYRKARKTYSGATTAELDRLFDEPLPEGGRDPALVLDECRRKVFRHSMHMSHPRIFGLFNLPFRSRRSRSCLSPSSTSRWMPGRPVRRRRTWKCGSFAG